MPMRLRGLTVPAGAHPELEDEEHEEHTADRPPKGDVVDGPQEQRARARDPAALPGGAA